MLIAVLASILPAWVPPDSILWRLYDMSDFGPLGTKQTSGRVRLSHHTSPTASPVIGRSYDLGQINRAPVRPDYSAEPHASSYGIMQPLPSRPMLLGA